MGVVVARFMEVGRWCSASERGKQSPKTNRQSHNNRRAAQNSTGTVHKRNNFMCVYLNRYFVTSVTM